jgi:hypothetical protein
MSHHWRDYEIDPQPPRPGPKMPRKWKLTFHACNDGPVITVVIPASGVFDNQDAPEKLKRDQVERLAHALSALFDAVLAVPDREEGAAAV